MGSSPARAKSIPLTDEVRELLRIEDEELSPPELIQAILRAPVDLLWFGGIGTYVKSADETPRRRRRPRQRRAPGRRRRAAGRGSSARAPTSSSPRGRIEYARRGGRIDQDAIHNAGGVDCSDHEVNVKILLASRSSAGLTRPEHATVLGSAKRRLTNQLLPTSLPDSPALQSVLDVYVPDLLVERFGDELRRHRLRRELVATRVANELVDRMGPTFPSRVAAEADFDEATVTAAWWTARDVTGVHRHWLQLEELLDQIGPENQGRIARELETLLGSLTRRYATEPGELDPDAFIERDRDAVHAYADALYGLGTADQRRHRVARAERLRDDLVPDDLAEFASCTRDLAFGPEVAATLRSLDWDADQAPLVGDVTLHLLEVLGLDRLHRVLDRTNSTTVWRRRLRRSLAADLRQLGARAAELALTEQTSDLLADGGTVAHRFAAHRSGALDRARRTITGVEQDVQAGLDGVTVALRTLRTAVESAR
jgi:glutamate dehydrogenase